LDDSVPSGPQAPYYVDLKLTHLDWNPEATLIQFQGQYLTICELDYTILHREMQKKPKVKAVVSIGDFCLVEDLTSGHWYRGRVQNQKKNLFDVFLIDHGNILSVDITHISSCSNDLLILPPKIVCGFLSSVLLFQDSCQFDVDRYFSSLIGRNVTGYIQAHLPYETLLLEAPDINSDLVRHGFGRHVDTNTFLFLVQTLTEVPLVQNIKTVPNLHVKKPRGQEFCFKLSALQGYIDILSVSGPRLSCGTCAKVRVSAAVDPGLFYCQMVNMEAVIKEMSKKLAVVCEHKIKDVKHMTENIDQLCSVKSKDENWYRCFVPYLPVNSQIRVLFIDYGYFETVRVENICSLPPDIWSVPIMAFPCALSCQDDMVKIKQISFLKAGLLGGVLDVEINRFDKEHHCYSITVHGVDHNPVALPDPVQHLTKMDPVDSDSMTKNNSLLGGYLCCETIMNEVMNKIREEVEVDSVFVGYVEHVHSPTEFWIRTQKRNDEFEELMMKMTSYYSQVKLDEDVLEDPQPGTICSAMYEADMHFYRAVVTDILEHGAEVFFIDFGNIEKVPKMLIKNIPETFASKTAFALRSTLANVAPLDEVWTSNNCDFFRQAVSNKALLVHVVQIRKDKFVVDLHELERDSDSITELLISSSQALYVKAIPREVVQNAKQNKTQFSRHCTLSDISGNTEQWEDCKKEQQTRKNEAEKPKASAGFRALTIKPGYEFAVCCSYINSPYDFWCQPLDKAPALKALMTEIQAYYSTFTIALQPGVLCCVVKSPQDGRWYRAFITEIQQSHARVMLVDYGFTIQVEHNSVQSILPEYMALEGQAFKCSLKSLIEPVDPVNEGDWSPDACNFLENFINNSTNSVRCKVVLQLNVKSKLCNVVDLCNIQTQQNITDVLVEQNLARKTAILPKQLSAVFPESFVFSPYGLSPGNEEQVYITHVSSQWEIYGQLEKNAKIIEELESKIAEENKKMMETSTRAVVRKLCLAKYLDGKWYRGLVHPVPSPLHLCVYFVDYGNMIIAEKANVVFVPRDSTYLLYTPMQGFRFTLASVSKEVLYADVKEWLDGTVLNKQMRAFVVGKTDNGSFDVELFDGEVNINKKVQELILSLSPKPKTVVSFDTRSRKPNKHAHRGTNSRQATQKKQNYTKNFPVKAQNKNIKAKHRKHTNETQKTMTEFKIKHERSHNSTTNEPQQTKEANIAQISHLPASKVRAGFRAKCFISHMDSISSFCLQLLEDEADILKMEDHLNSCVFRDSLQTCASVKLKRNDLVLAEYKKDGALYRAVVKDYEGSSSLKVEFIDYGNSAVIKEENIYSIPKDYISQHRFGITCSLLDASAWESNASFSDTVMDNPVMVDFVHQNGSHWEVKIEILNGAVSVKHETSVENAKVCVTLLAKNKSVSTKNQRDSLKLTVKGENSDNAMEPPTINVTNTESGKVLSVQSNGDFYIRLNEGSDKLVILEKLIADSLEKCETLPEEDVKEGLKCLVRVDNQWQRAVVQHVDQKRCQVLLVDHGITQGVPRDSITQQCNSLTNIPAFAVLCRLKYFTELLEFSEEAENDQKLCYETLKTMIGKEVKLVFLHCSETDHLWFVEIVLNEPSLFRQISTSLQKNEAMITQSPAETQTEDSSLPQQLEFAPVHIDREYSGFVAAVTTPFEFCVVLEDSHFILNIVSNMLNEIPQLTVPLLEAHIIPGTSCMLKSDSNGKWCRAEIMHSDTTIVLNLVDYGHYECLPYEERFKLKRLPEKIMKLPKFTYPCVLRGVKPSEGGSQWNDEAAFFFKQCMYQKNIKIFFREFVSNIHWKVDVLADGVHVTKKLVNAGHASYVDIMLGLRYALIPAYAL
uniref:Si:dkeyp-93d12.1 n=1 Tax=Sphaeramia orbicularis TaxID=375764 RepID=A0A673C4P4_9TELE